MMNNSGSGTRLWRRSERSLRFSRRFEADGCPSWRINCNILEMPSCHDHEVHLDLGPIVTYPKPRRLMDLRRRWLLLLLRLQRSTRKEQDRHRIPSSGLLQQWLELSPAVWPAAGLLSRGAMKNPRLFTSNELALTQVWKGLLEWKFTQLLQWMIQSLQRTFQGMVCRQANCQIWHRISTMRRRTARQAERRAHTRDQPRRLRTVDEKNMRKTLVD